MEAVVWTLVGIVEVYYWFWWLPRNADKVKDVDDFKFYVDTVWKKGVGIK